jgi:nucleotide-binding universal stress UspA family protein
MFKRIVVPLDGSALSEQALGYGADMASRYRARLVLLRAFDGRSRSAQLLARMPMELGAAASYQRIVDQEATTAQEAETEVRAYLAEHQKCLAMPGLAVDVLVADADAAEAILAEAEREPATLVVMSTHGRGGLGRLVFGSVAQAVLQRSSVPLLLIRAENA